MTFRLFGIAGLSFALIGCVDDKPAAATAAAAPDEKGKAADEPKAAAAVAELLQHGLEDAQKGEMEKASEQIGKAVKLDPKNRQGLFFLAAIDQELAGKAADRVKKNEFLLRSADSIRKLRDVDKTLRPREKGLFAFAVYNEACVYAFQKKDDKALASLSEAIEAGFTDSKTLLADADLASLRKRPEFTALTAKIEEVVKKELAELVTNVKTEMTGFKSFPFSFDLPDLEGKSVKLADFKGKVTIVDVWGTWCPPCREEVPHFVELNKKYKEKGLAIVGINYEKGDKDKWKSLISSFVAENHVNYPCVIGDDKTQEMIPEFSAFPTTLFIDREGKVRFKLIGSSPAPVLEAIVTLLLDEPAAKKAATP